MFLKVITGLVLIALGSGRHGALARSFSDLSIDCNVNSVVISVNSTTLNYAYPDLEADRLFVGDDFSESKCRPIDGPRGLKFFQFDYGDCTPEVVEINDNDVRFIYTVSGAAEGSDVMSINHDVIASCVLPKDGLQAATVSEQASEYQYVGDDVGPYKFAMTIYRDAFMTNAVGTDDEVPLGAPLWVGVKLDNSATSEMYIRDCWATSSPTSNDFEHIFIKNSIIGEDDDTFSPIDDVITANSYGFSFDAFMFRGSSNRVYIKCNMHVCSPKYTLLHPELCATPKYPEFFRGERDLDFGSGMTSGSGYQQFVEANQPATDVVTEEAAAQEAVQEAETEEEEVKGRSKRDVTEYEDDIEDTGDRIDFLQEAEPMEDDLDSDILNDNDMDNFRFGVDEDEDETESESDAEESGSGSGSGSGDESESGSGAEDASSSGSGSGDSDTALRFEASGSLGAEDGFPDQREYPVFYIMHSFKVKALDRRRKSTSGRVYPRRTLYSTVRNGITLGIIIASTAMLSACAVLLPMLFSGEKMRCLHVKPTKRVI